MSEFESSVQRDYADHLIEEVVAGRMTRAQLLRRATVVGLSFPTIGALLSACGGGGGSSAPPKAQPGSRPVKAVRGGRVRVGMIAPGAALDPVAGFDSASIASAQLVAEYLNWVEPDAMLRPVLAEKWTPSSDGKSWTFTLRKGVTFSDGRPLTADDVVATFERLVKAENSNLAGILSKGNTEKVDDQTVTFHLDRAFVSFPVIAGSSNYNAVILPRDYNGHFGPHTPGTGAFLLKSVRQQQAETFARRDGYWQRNLPYLDGVNFAFFADNQPEVLALQGKSIDVMLDTPYQGSQALASAPGIDLLAAQASAYRSLHMRVDRKPWNDKRVRQALAYTLDREKIVKGLLNGRGDVGNDHIFAPMYKINTGVPQRTQDYEKAKQLLADAGYPNGIHATLTTEQYLEIPQYVQIVQEMAKPAGFNLRLDIEDQTKYYGSGKNQPWLDVPLGVVDWTSRPVPSAHINVAFRSDAKWNVAHWRNPEFDRLATELDATLDEGSRNKIAAQMAEIQHDEVPVIIAYWLNRLRAVSDKVNGIGADPAANLDLTKTSISAAV